MTIDDFRATMAKLISDALLTYKLHPADLLSVLEDEAALQGEIKKRAGRRWPRRVLGDCTDSPREITLCTKRFE